MKIGDNIGAKFFHVPPLYFLAPPSEIAVTNICMKHSHIYDLSVYLVTFDYTFKGQITYLSRGWVS